ncbi:MAG: hypothetical protein ACXWIP_07995 [Burkholderiales bacterium]
MNELTHEDTCGLHEALDTTCRTWATYDQVVRDFGPIAPFPTIRDAEESHMIALEALFVRLGLRLPNTRCRAPVPHFQDLSLALRAAIAAEKDNLAIYARVSAGARDAEIAAEIGKLQRDCREHHLPALQGCAIANSNSANRLPPSRAARPNSAGGLTCRTRNTESPHDKFALGQRYSVA